MDTSPAQLARQNSVANPYVLGTMFGLLSSVVYTAANSFLTAVNYLDPVWVSAVKAVPTVALIGPVLVVLALRGQKVVPGAGTLAAIGAGGLVGQLGGNILFQWSLSQIGVALTVPLSLGGMILFAAVLGRIFLHEPVTLRAAGALVVLLAAIFVLSLGAREASDEVAKGPVSLVGVLAGVAAACFAGLAYSVLNVVLRYHITRGAPLPATLFTVSLCGMVALSVLSVLRIGGQGMAATSRNEWLLMLGAGLCNTVAFISLTKSLQLTSVVWVNALNATQATMAAIAGVMIFEEPLSPWLAAGIGLTVIGLMLLAHAHRVMRAEETV